MASNVGVMTARFDTPLREEAILVLDNLELRDKPSAVGYFLLDSLRGAYRKHGFLPPVQVQFGFISPMELGQLASQGKVYSTRMREGDFGDMYALIADVERNRRSDDPTGA